MVGYAHLNVHKKHGFVARIDLKIAILISLLEVSVKSSVDEVAKIISLFFENGRKVKQITTSVKVVEITKHRTGFDGTQTNQVACIFNCK